MQNYLRRNGENFKVCSTRGTESENDYFSIHTPALFKYKKSFITLKINVNIEFRFGTRIFYFMFYKRIQTKT